MNLIKTGIRFLSPPSSSRSRLMILCHHRVLEERDPLQPDTPTAEEFGRQLNWLKELCTIIPLSEGITRLKAGTLPANALSITFDDGYLDNLTVAGPILEAMDVQATLFITTEPLREGIMWNDLIIEAVRASEPSSAFAIQEIEEQLGAHKYLHWQERLSRARQVFSSRTNANANAPRLMLAPDQLSEVLTAGFEIGAHTLNHPILKTLSESEAETEIVGSADVIEALTGTRPSLFAYPNGRLKEDYDETHSRMVEEAGFIGAVSTNWGAASVKDPLFELPRFLPWEQDQVNFGLRLLKTLIKS